MGIENKQNRISELVEILNRASESYYAKDEEIMSNFEYDALYDELVRLEEETGIVLPQSPTQNVGFESVDFLPKERHEKPMLSLAKTKSVDELASWLNGKTGLLSWKLDGLTVVLTYENGVLAKAVTRGNGEVGEVITPNAKTFINLPKEIEYKGKLIVRGEAVISYPDFEAINAKIDNPDDKYKNPRNLCSGSVRQLNSKVTKERNVRVVVFSFVSAEGLEFATRKSQFEFLDRQGFETVEYLEVTPETIADSVSHFAAKIENYEIPSDGLVLAFDDIEYGKSLGMTAKFPRDSIAFKWQDETAKTILREIEWSPSRTGLINPVAVFDTVSLEGTSVSRASVHNLSVMEEMKLGIGDEILVYKANMIIPQIAKNLTQSGNMTIPSVCPCCGGITERRAIKEAESLYCTNPECPAKQIKKFALMVSRDAFNVEGLSEATLEKFVDEGFIKEFADIFTLSRYKDNIILMDGFGEKSYQNLAMQLDKAKLITPAKLLYSLGIENVGLATAKVISRAFDDDFGRVRSAQIDDLSCIEGVGEVIAGSVVKYFADEANCNAVNHLLEVIEIAEVRAVAEGELSGKTVVITGSLNMFENREAMRDAIEQRGGKVSGSVSAKTFVLVNNDIESTSSKNKTAKSLNIPIMTEADFVSKYLG